MPDDAAMYIVSGRSIRTHSGLKPAANVERKAHGHATFGDQEFAALPDQLIGRELFHATIVWNKS
jgi:hypothetical protein